MNLSRRLGPLHTQDQVIVTTSVNRLLCALRILTHGERNESETLASTSVAVARQEDTRDVAETLEQLADIGLGGVLGQVGDTERGLLVALLAASVATGRALVGTGAEVGRDIAGSANLLIGLGDYFT